MLVNIRARVVSGSGSRCLGACMSSRQGPLFPPLFHEHRVGASQQLSSEARSGHHLSNCHSVRITTIRLLRATTRDKAKKDLHKLALPLGAQNQHCAKLPFAPFVCLTWRPTGLVSQRFETNWYTLVYKRLSAVHLYTSRVLASQNMKCILQRHPASFRLVNS